MDGGMYRRLGRALLATAFAITAVSCSRILPLDDAASEASQVDFSNLAAPLDLVHFEVVSSGAGYRGVFLRLSRFPESIQATHTSKPARIVLDIYGPTGTESAAESFPGGDQVVTQVHVSREIGRLRVVLDLAGSSPPSYTVHRMADWIMLRMQPAG